MKTRSSFKFATEFGDFFKLERKKAEIGKYLVIQRYEMVYVLKYVLSDRQFIFVEIRFCDNQMTADNVAIKHIYHISYHIFGEGITLQHQEKFHFII